MGTSFNIAQSSINQPTNTYRPVFADAGLTETVSTLLKTKPSHFAVNHGHESRDSSAFRPVTTYTRKFVRKTTDKDGKPFVEAMTVWMSDYNGKKGYQPGVDSISFQAERYNLIADPAGSQSRAIQDNYRGMYVSIEKNVTGRYSWSPLGKPEQYQREESDLLSVQTKPVAKMMIDAVSQWDFEQPNQTPLSDEEQGKIRKLDQQRTQEFQQLK